MARSKAETHEPGETLPITIAITVLWLLLHRALAEVLQYFDRIGGMGATGPLA